MHFRSLALVPLKDNRNLMYFAEELKHIKRGQFRPEKFETQKKLHMPTVPNENDILLGRGGKNNMHVGNEKLRQLARAVAEKYHRSSKKEKSNLSRQLIDKVRNMEPQGRFLRRTKDGKDWEDVSHDDERCREKAAQVLRDAVAYIGLKDQPVSPEDEAIRSQHSPYMPPYSHPMHPMHHLSGRDHPADPMPSLRRESMSFSSTLPLDPPAMSYSARSPSSMARGGIRRPPVPNTSFYNVARRFPLAPGQGSGPPFPPMPYGYPPNMPHRFSAPTNTHPVPPSPHLEYRPPKRRRMSNFFERYAALPPPEAYGQRLSSDHSQSTIASDVPSPYQHQLQQQFQQQQQQQQQQQRQRYAYFPPPMEAHDRRLSVSNIQPSGGSDPFIQQQSGSRGAIRKDSLLGSISLGATSEHSMSSARDFELFPDIGTEHADSSIHRRQKSEEGDEFSSEFY